MNLARCERGHYFDGSKYTACPYCGIILPGKTAASPQQHMIVTGSPSADPEGVTVCRIDRDEAVTVTRSTKDDDLRTVVKYSSENGSRMVVGWLLCTVGVDKGADYRLYAGNNTVGRGDHPDIRLYDDPDVIKGVHCTITYDPKQNDFFILPGAGAAVKQNGEMIHTPQRLVRYDRLEVGNTELTFVPYCEGGYHW